MREKRETLWAWEPGSKYKLRRRDRGRFRELEAIDFGEPERDQESAEWQSVSSTVQPDAKQVSGIGVQMRVRRSRKPRVRPSLLRWAFGRVFHRFTS